MDTVNSALTRTTAWVLGWFAGFSPFATLVFWSAVVGVLMAVVFRYTSNQRALKIATDRSRAQVLAIDLFGHDLRAIFSSLGQLLRYAGLRLWWSLPPLLVMFVPFTILLSQIALWYEHLPLEKGKSTTVKLELTETDWPKSQFVSLEPSPQLAIETPPLRDPVEHAIYWRLRPKDTMPGVLRWHIGDTIIDKRVDVAADPQRLTAVSTRRPGRGWWDRVVHPAEPACPPGDPVCGIEIEHGRRETLVFGVDVPWWLTFVLTSIIAALLARPFLNVRF